MTFLLSLLFEVARTKQQQLAKQNSELRIRGVGLGHEADDSRCVVGAAPIKTAVASAAVGRALAPSAIASLLFSIVTQASHSLIRSLNLFAR